MNDKETSNKRNTWLSWSSGKDSAWSALALLRDEKTRLAGVFTSVNATFDRVAMHGTRTELLRRQADALGLPLYTIELPYPCSNAVYESKMAEFTNFAQSQGAEAFAYGDLFLQDVRDYRIAHLKDQGIAACFPLWQRPTAALAQEMVAAGLRAVITCVDPKQAPKELAGRVYDQQLIDELPTGVDPCGENGEFHTFVYAGPMFTAAIPIAVGDIVERDGFVFADVLLNDC